MSAVPAPVEPEGEPPCPVHPYGYHRRPRVNPARRRHVFRHVSPVGLPARCARLELELDRADRELDFLDELWVRERANRGHGLAVVGAAVVGAVVAALVLGSATTSVVVIALLAGGALVAGLDRIDGALHRERLRRIRDWHRRVGTPR